MSTIPEPTKSDKELLKLLQKASTQKEELRLMRIGGPRRFRHEVFSFSEKDTGNINAAINALKSPDIRKIIILLSNPGSEAFFRRLDTEKASIWKVWRVMRQIHRFAEKLLSINPAIDIALHSEELIWNLGIIGEHEAMVTPYGCGTGHDDSSEQQWFSDDRNGLSSSFFNYFEAVSRKSDTLWLEHGKNYSNENPKWTGLFKGNAILARKEDIDGTEEPILKEDEICKICTSNRSKNAEEKWLSISLKHRKILHSFKPGHVVRLISNFRGDGLVLKRYEGPTLFELAVYLKKVSSENIGLKNKISSILEMIFEDTLVSLSEFQSLSKVILPDTERVTYPYAKKISDAVTGIRRHFPYVSGDIWNAALSDTEELGEDLEKEACVPFRDAHIKNRIWNEDLTLQEISDALVKSSMDEVYSSVKSKIIDVDFETAGYNVTVNDDPFHVLFFEYSVFDSYITITQKQHLFEKTQSLFAVNADLTFWRTGLARSLREYCRRLWYRRVMPNTFEQRYSKENPDYFLRLALECSSRSSGFLNIRTLLENLEAESSGRPVDFSFICEKSFLKNRSEKTTISDQDSIPEIIKREDDDHKAGIKVFVSYSHKDRGYLEKLERILKILRRAGLINSWDDKEILPGMEWDKEIKEKLSESDIVIFLVSYDFLASDYIADVEIDEALKKFESGSCTLVPVIIRSVSLKNTIFNEIQVLPDEGKPVALWDDEDSAWQNIEEKLRNIIENKCTAE